MKGMFAIVFLYGILIPCAYGETIIYDSDTRYEGDVSNGVSHGYGILTWGGGAQHIGEFKNGLADGWGTHPHLVLRGLCISNPRSGGARRCFVVTKAVISELL
jgi:hypothetical protein